MSCRHSTEWVLMLASSLFVSVGMTPTSRNASCVVLKIVTPTPNASIPSLVSNPCNRSASNRVLCCSSFSLILSRYLVSASIACDATPCQSSIVDLADVCRRIWSHVHLQPKDCHKSPSANAQHGCSRDWQGVHSINARPPMIAPQFVIYLTGCYIEMMLQIHLISNHCHQI